MISKIGPEFGRAFLQSKSYIPRNLNKGGSVQATYQAPPCMDVRLVPLNQGTHKSHNFTHYGIHTYDFLKKIMQMQAPGYSQRKGILLVSSDAGETGQKSQKSNSPIVNIFSATQHAYILCQL